MDFFILFSLNFAGLCFLPLYFVSGVTFIFKPLSLPFIKIYHAGQLNPVKVNDWRCKSYFVTVKCGSDSIMLLTFQWTHQ